MSRFGNQFAILAMQAFRSEWREKERLVGPILFAAVIQLLFSFSLGSLSADLAKKVFVAQSILTSFIALQAAYIRIFEPDSQDKVFDIIRTYPVSREAWFLAKTLVVTVTGLTIVVPTVIVGAMFQSQSNLGFDNTAILRSSMAVIAITSLVIGGLAPLGVLLSAMTLKASARQLLFPLIYFPLTTPVLLAAVNGTDILLGTAPGSAFPWNELQGWLTILVAFDAIYFTLGLLLFREVIDAG